MGASLGLALGLPAWQALTVFAAMGLGMALPFLAASLSPALARALPRPGPWMVTLRQALAFPMLATVVWLVWVLGQQSGIDGAGTLLGLLVLMALVIWALTLNGKARAVIATLSVAAGAYGIWAVGPNITKVQEAGSVSPALTTGWQAWEPGRVDQLTASGQSVFVDFTAAWCVTCQYNKRTTLADATVLDDLAGKNVALLRADWTRRDPAVTAALTQLGRSGVPVYVIYKPGRAPVLLRAFPMLNRRTFASSVALAALAAGTHQAHAAAAVGQAAPDFTATDALGRTHKLSDFKGKHVVLEWTNPGCPFVVKHYSGNMQALQSEFTGKGVVWLSVNSTVKESRDYLTPAKLMAWKAEKKAAVTADIDKMVNSAGWKTLLETKGWANTYLSGAAFDAQL
eukprot:gene42743-56819_t